MECGWGGGCGPGLLLLPARGLMSGMQRTQEAVGVSWLAEGSRYFGGLGCRVWRVRGQNGRLECHIRRLGCHIRRLGCHIWGLGCHIWGLGCHIWGLGCQNGQVRGQNGRLGCHIWRLGCHHWGSNHRIRWSGWVVIAGAWVGLLSVVGLLVFSGLEGLGWPQVGTRAGSSGDAGGCNPLNRAAATFGGGAADSQRGWAGLGSATTPPLGSGRWGWERLGRLEGL